MHSLCHFLAQLFAVCGHVAVINNPHHYYRIIWRELELGGVVHYKKSTIAWQFFCGLALSTQLSAPPLQPELALCILCTILIKYKMFTLIISAEIPLVGREGEREGYAINFASASRRYKLQESRTQWPQIVSYLCCGLRCCFGLPCIVCCLLSPLRMQTH